jgi:hypothetical protein
MTVVRQANRRDLNPTEITELDATMAEYKQARDDAYAVYMDLLVKAGERRDARIAAAIRKGGRSTQSRIGDYLGFHRNTMVAINRRGSQHVPQAA